MVRRINGDNSPNLLSVVLVELAVVKILIPLNVTPVVLNSDRNLDVEQLSDTRVVGVLNLTNTGAVALHVGHVNELSDQPCGTVLQ